MGCSRNWTEAVRHRQATNMLTVATWIYSSGRGFLGVPLWGVACWHADKINFRRLGRYGGAGKDHFLLNYYAI
jgi:hypothetical protein